jgi:NAD(P)-dependent dehydrogenase (short-subunit alcohol dehydrogenase family)
MTAWEIAGKHVLITGASAGIGKATALDLARRGAILTLAGRSKSKTRQVIDEISEEGGSAGFLLVDLATPSYVKRASQEFLDRQEPLHVLINNAGVGGTKGITAEGFELAFATNHLGHHLLTRWLEPRLIESSPARLIVVASSVHHNVKEVKWKGIQKRTSSLLGVPEYRISKLANILDARRWAQQLEGTGVDVHIVHPGLVASEIWRDLPVPLRRMFAGRGQTIEEGARTSIWAATNPDLEGVSGGYYGNRAEKRISDLASDAELTDLMWKRTERWLADWLPPG